jgi:(R,R)-butanediol dehydrogenase/meso-butanediol dehydrogenase/diacetyl reductase
VVVDAAMLFALPAVLDERAAALAEPTAVAVHAVAKAQLTAGDRVVVVGAGPIGVITALVLRARGFEDVMLVSRNAARASVAQGLGLATLALDDAHAAAGAPAVFECAGTSAAANLALELVGPLGRVILVGIAPDGLTIPATAIVFKEAEIRGALVYRRTEFAEAIAMLADGRVPADALISDVVGLDRAEEMFQALTAPGNDRIKVLLAP